jgi:hypothetical protein
VADGDYTVELLFTGQSAPGGAPFTITRSTVIHWSTN